MKTQNAISHLNSLLKINDNRIAGYGSAANETNESDLKEMFGHFIQTSRRCRAELVSEVRRLGGTPANNTAGSGKFFRVWMDVKAIMTGEERHALLDSCEYGEHHALKKYDEVLNDHYRELNPSLLSILRSQYEELRAGHDTVRSMREVFAA